MNVGDPKKAIVLSIVAVIIVCAAVFRSIPMGKPAVALRTANRTAEKPEAEKPAKEEQFATVDTFSHPNLASTRADKPAVKPRPKTGTTQQPLSLRGLGVLPDAKNGGNPEKFTGIDQQPSSEVTLITVRLDAVVRGASSLALLTVAGKQSAPVSEGDVINEHIRVLKIRESSVQILVGKERFTINVGDEVRL